jgi:transcriptional regulator with XRE-family HTH domain
MPVLSLRKLREKRGLTQKGLAAASALEQTTISSLETGVIANPRKSTIEALAQGLECSILDVWHGINQSVKEAHRAEARNRHRASAP